MATRAADPLLQSVRALVAGRGESDQELLDRFVRQHDEAAFATLVERHGPMVLGVCRRGLRDEHAAEDTFQATFLVLARNAGSIHERRALSSWLHGVALRLVRRARVTFARAQRDKARIAPEAPREPAVEASWSEVRQILDDELKRLPENYRLPLVLCALEGRSREEAAAEMGCTPSQLKGLLERGRERLRARLIRRGLAPSSIGALLLTEEALAVPVPPLLAIATRRITRGLSATTHPTDCELPLPVRSLIARGLSMIGAKRLGLVLVFAVVATAVGLSGFDRPETAPAPHAVADRSQKSAPATNKRTDLLDDEAAVAAHIKALHDPDSTTREKAATALRRIVAKYPSGTVYLPSKDGGEAEWKAKVDRIEPGSDKSEMLKILPPLTPGDSGGGLVEGDSHYGSYRLDYHWIVRICYRDTGKMIRRPELMKNALRVHVAPPKDFTGTWTTWHINGQKSYDYQYKNGKSDGVFTSYHDNGAKNHEQHYTADVAHGTGTGWFPDGKVNYTIQYRNGKLHGTWTHWYANGNKHSEANYADGEYHGRQTNWHENGQLGSVTDYKNGVKHGVEASWNENGIPHYDRLYLNGKIVN
ncbi:sigma-70 family rna polymerase sigma factor : RNA polymerase sigma factor, sigma-70 family OS=Singulisphaera acidiphila (strain ATCC BAA-1392 / DSM 18658 / VKM B-2454 / MOB10) GN=Sinac_2497 PE=4 SV=1: Sigma70_r2: Sigma70_r4_2: MORN_2: MORN_2: MORN_2 [Gemmata massiliana]|uniref:RNA polymerase sigma-70 region 2 domain-containing protein n=1 Tax=Gemmata massiliana TaxID=1210884 RepID=A0A6P2D0Y8_9BACT|nr:sigma-70 family RNA polymerase sigma factor [Gemmata massiliana]VTR94921.1 sigma-70 family rna polymerase sigma factor : RNA polymerase sigma factor, sigma-70 family OS=Singulisphaera acidiphila (strain ATCC BAA-1392 / DSM 18658 / VKM B-2454 / MOB10) GN=Sinac_2497 PE=4 SV=1: Sigma70_r2: Sigma70_r4_2: MORN_2: MORN_2: MORN_2 [Gemmata massiliana]